MEQQIESILIEKLFINAEDPNIKHAVEALVKLFEESKK